MSRLGLVRDRLTRAGAVRARGDLAAYVPLAVATTAASVAGRERAHLATKMLLAPTLSAGVLASRDRRPAGRTAALTVALVGSAIGDWFMNASDRTTTPAARRSLIRRGASAFAVQQAGLVGMQLLDGARPELRSAAAVSAVLAGLGLLDAVGTGEPDPILTGYGLLLGSMSALALSEATTGRRRRTVALGGGLFLLSDAAIIVGEHLAKTPRQQAVASGIVMSTYAAALALLVHGLRDSPTAPQA